MQVLCGTDIVEIKRMCKLLGDYEEGCLPSFVTRCFTSDEIEYCMSKKLKEKQIECFAGRYAAKEAASKAIGTGILTRGISLLDFEILSDEYGAPKLFFRNKASLVTMELGITSSSISISHDGDYAISYCTLLVDKKV